MGGVESRERIYWVNDLEKAVLIAGLTRKPILLMILKSLCPTCKTLEPEYGQDKDFRVLSKFFVMARSVDQKQVEETYVTDGHYVPRILFLDTQGKPMLEFYNETAAKPDAKYFYSQAEEIVNTMRNVLYRFYSFNKNEVEYSKWDVLDIIGAESTLPYTENEKLILREVRRVATHGQIKTSSFPKIHTAMCVIY